jgi:hypothetical protein
MKRKQKDIGHRKKNKNTSQNSFKIQWKNIRGRQNRHQNSSIDFI